MVAGVAGGPARKHGEEKEIALEQMRIKVYDSTADAAEKIGGRDVLMTRLFWLITLFLSTLLPRVVRGDDLQNAGFEEGTQGWSQHTALHPPGRRI